MEKMRKTIISIGVIFAVLALLYFFVFTTQGEKRVVTHGNTETIANSWKVHRPIEFPRYAASACELNGKIYVVGGKIKNGREFVNKTEIYDPNKKEWIEGPPLNIPRAKFAMTVFEGKIYVFGGESERGIVREIEVLDPKKGKWEIIGKMPYPRKGLSAVTYNGKIHILCGESEEEKSLKIHQVYDPKRGKWIEKPPAPIARHAASLVVYGGKLYLIGGWNRENNVALNNVDVYDPAKENWSSDSALPVSVYAAGCGIINNKIVLVGGFADPAGEVPLAIMQYFDGKKWFLGERIPTPRGWTGSAVLGDTLYIIGGTSGFDTLEIVEKYSFSSH